MSQKRTCLLVLGMHRSGTSALTRALSLMGASLPANVLGANQTNETGHWEPERLIQLHDQMLTEAGSRWDDWRGFDLADLSRPRAQHYRAEIARLIAEEFGTARLFVLKEPRISRFVPLYADILLAMKVEVKYILTSRNPLSVIASLGKRDRFTGGFAALLWLRHELDAERATRDKSRVFVSYEALLADCRGQIGKIGDGLSLAWPRALDEAAAEIAGYVREEHSHHSTSDEQLFADERVPAWVKDGYAALKALEKDPRDAAASAALDRVKAEFDVAAPLFGTAFFPEIEARQKTCGEAAAALQRTAEELVAENARLAETIKRERDETASREADLRAQIAAKPLFEAAEAEQAAAVTELEDRVAELQAAVERAETERAALAAESRQRLTEWEALGEERSTEMARLSAALEQQVAEAASYRVQIEDQSTRFKRLMRRLSGKLAPTAKAK